VEGSKCGAKGRAQGQPNDGRQGTWNCRVRPTGTPETPHERTCQGRAHGTFTANALNRLHLPQEIRAGASADQCRLYTRTPHLFLWLTMLGNSI
jgi:hypothetical protein